MPKFDSTTLTKLATLRAAHPDGSGIEIEELVQIDWPSPDGTIYYGVTQVDEISSVAPSVSPIETRLMASSSPDWFLPHKLGSLIGDETIDLTFWDGDSAMTDLILTHSEGVKVILHFWFPEVELLLPVWQGHLRNEEDNSFGLLKLKAAQGFRASDAIVPGRAHWEVCQRIFGGLLTTQAEIDEHGCNYNLNIGGSVGTNDPDTGLPWTFCPRLTTANCTERGINPLRHMSHATMTQTVVNNQTHGGALFSTSEGNNTRLTDPVRVVLGQKRIFDMPVMAFRRDLDNNHPEDGFFFADYEACEGPIEFLQDVIVKVGSDEQAVNPVHFGFRLGDIEQTPASALSAHGFSNLAYITYNFGRLDPSKVGPADASAIATVRGLNDTRIYSDPDTFVEGWDTLPGTHLMRILCDKRWGFGLDYARLDIQSFIDLNDWADDYVRFTDTFGTDWEYYRATSNMELVGRKIQQQIEDYCRAMFISKPFLFDSKITVMPLTALTSDELDACPVFTDEGDSPNIIFNEDSGVFDSTLSISRASDLDLPNRIECTYDDILGSYVETPLNPIEDVDAQLRAGRVVGDHSRKTNKKDYSLLGVVVKEQAIRVAWGLLDRGEFDTGGLQNNCRIKFQIWFADALQLHPYKVIKVVNSKLQDKYGFTYFRILGDDGLEKKNNLYYEVTAQAYNVDYMDAFETVISPPGGGGGDGGGGDGGGGDGGGGCILTFGDISHTDGVLEVPIEPC